MRFRDVLGCKESISVTAFYKKRYRQGYKKYLLAVFYFKIREAK